MRPINAGDDFPIPMRRSWADGGHGASPVGPRFESLLETADAQTNGFPADPRSSLEARLRGGFAQVFNAFGFFAHQPQAGPGNPAGPAQAEAMTAEPPPGPGLADVLSGSAAAARQPTDDGAPPGPAAAALASPATGPGTAAPVFTAGSSGIAADKSAGPGTPPPTPAGSRAANPQAAASTSKAPPSFPPIEIGRLGGPAPLAPVSDPPGSSVRAAPGPRSDAADHFAFRIDGQIVELTARLGNLGAEEESRLRDALSDLAERHGLSLGIALVNGRPLPAARSGGEQSCR